MRDKDARVGAQPQPQPPTLDAADANALEQQLRALLQQAEVLQQQIKIARAQEKLQQAQALLQPAANPTDALARAQALASFIVDVNELLDVATLIKCDANNNAYYHFKAKLFASSKQIDASIPVTASVDDLRSFALALLARADALARVGQATCVGKKDPGSRS